MLDDDLPENGASARPQGTLLDVAQERIRGLDEQVVLLQGQLALEQERNSELLKELTTTISPPIQERPRLWWRFWS